MASLFAAPTAHAVPIRIVDKASWPTLRQDLPEAARRFAEACGFEAAAGRHLVLPQADGAVDSVVFAREAPDARFRDPFLLGKLVNVLPAGTYRLELAGSGLEPGEAALAALGFLLSSYRFRRYKTGAGDALPALIAPDGVDAAHLERMAEAVAFARDLVNTPANDMGPVALAEAALDMGRHFGAQSTLIEGDELLEGNFPLIHAVGKAAEEPPRLVDLRWGPADAPKVTLVGKGVCFDTGGLDIKPSSAMALMKKDMTGAATALAIARMVMSAGLKVNLRVLLPIVENAVGGNAFRPGDVYPSRKGIAVEIGNTDAEGRLILADALALACEEKPELLFDFATLTGAARVALGPDLPPFYTMDESLAAEIAQTGRTAHDPVWRLPLWEPYDSLLDAQTGTLNNISSGPFAGSITAALFLRRFVDVPGWAHFDIYGWSPSTKPGRPEGGDPQTARLVFDLIARRYGG